MKSDQKNYAFIDSQNLNLGIQSLGWTLDYRKFRVYLREKYSVAVAYIFIGYVQQNQGLYASLQKAGYILIFKPVLQDSTGRIKGNVDADLVLQAMIDYAVYDRAVIVTSDGDFYCLAKYLYNTGKLYTVLSPSFYKCSVLLKKAAKEKIRFIENVRSKVELK